MKHIKIFMRGIKAICNFYLIGWIAYVALCAAPIYFKFPSYIVLPWYLAPVFLCAVLVIYKIGESEPNPSENNK